MLRAPRSWPLSSILLFAFGVALIGMVSMVLFWTEQQTGRVAPAHSVGAGS